MFIFPSSSSASSSTRPAKANWVVCGALCSLWSVHQALAYRPFDSTDADATPRGEAELERQPLGYLQEGQNRYFVSPATVVNFGIAGEREIVPEGQVREARDTSPDVPQRA